MIDRWFRAHPRSVGESYAAHLGVATRFGAAMIAGGVAALIHGLFPRLFEKTGSATVRRLHDRLEGRGSPPPAG